MNHDELVKEILFRARKRYIWCWPTPPPNPMMEAGWVDVVVLGSRGALFVEVKSTDGRRTMKQISVAHLLTRAGLTYRLWRPADLNDGTIDNELEAIALPTFEGIQQEPPGAGVIGPGGSC